MIILKIDGISFIEGSNIIVIGEKVGRLTESIQLLSCCATKQSKPVLE